MGFRDEVCALLLAEESRAVGDLHSISLWRHCYGVGRSGGMQMEEPLDGAVGPQGDCWHIVKPSHLHSVKSVQT